MQIKINAIGRGQAMRLVLHLIFDIKHRRTESAEDRCGIPVMLGTFEDCILGPSLPGSVS